MLQSPNNNNIFRLVPNPNFNQIECDRSKNVESTFINLSNYNIENPKGLTGILCEKDTIVIPPSISFKMKIEYPLSNPIEVNIKSSNKGITLKKLILLIKNYYINIYREEEITSTARLYTFRKPCEECLNIDIKKQIKRNIQTEKNKICSICQDSINLTASILKCGHVFHENCIDRWVDSDGKNCPICRDNLYSCNSCNGYGFTILNYEGVVIPVNLRGNVLNRNHTDGIFGIYGHDFENLFLKSLFFDRINRRLYIRIIS